MNAGVKVREVGASEGFGMILPLIRKHHAEIETFTDTSEVSVDLENYLQAERDGRLIVLVAELEGQVIGYCSTLLSRHLHYSHMIFAQSDALYVLPQFRDTHTGALLMTMTVGLAKARGATVMLWHAKQYSKFDLMLPKHGYEVIDVIWGRKL